jgi:2-dehydropantoate 2-reductase
MKIGVVGAGAIGCWVGGRLAAAKEDVVFVGRERTKRDLETNGLVVLDPAGGTPPATVAKEDVRIVLEPAELADRDVILVCVKSAQTEEVAKDLARVLEGKRVLVASMQNGVRNAETLREHLGGHVVLGGIVEFNVVAKDGGEYRRTTTGSLVFEHTDDPRLAELGAALERSAIGHVVAKDIRAIQWSKLMMNVNNAVGALTDVPTQRLIFEEPYRRIVRALIEESLRVLRCADVKPARLGPLPPKLFPYLLRLPTPVVKILSRVQVSIDPEARSSMWDDLTRGRLTEVDFLNGEIVRLAGSCGTEAPLNAQIVRLVHKAERDAKGSPKLSARELWNALNENQS